MTEFSKKPQTASDLQRRAEAAAAASIRRYQGRKVLNRVSGHDACKGCGRRVLDPETGVIYARSSRGYVVTIGLVRCGKIWFCPECSASIRRGRTEEIKTAALRWLAAGGTLAVAVLTARHNVTHELARISAALWGEPMLDDDGDPVLDRGGKPRRDPGAYQRMLTDPIWYGRNETVSFWQRKDGSFGMSVREGEPGIRHRIGYAGMVRASEVTRSLENGWHPHMNLLIFIGGTVDGTPAKGTVTGHFAPSKAALDEWEGWLREMWAGALAKADPKFRPSTECATSDCKCEGKGHGLKLQIVTSADDQALIDYLTKTQDGKAPADSVRADLEAATGAAMETARADSKSYKGHSVTPFQLLYRLYDIEVQGLTPKRAEGYGTPAQCRIWWAEYETAMAGRRAIEWTRGLRGHVGLTGDDSEETDQKFVYEPDQSATLTGGVILTPDAVATVVNADVELDLQDVIKAELYDAAGDFVSHHGGRATHVRVATPEELAEVQENLFARLATKQTAKRVERLVLKLRAERDDALKALPADAPAKAAADLQQRFFKKLAAVGAAPASE
ncbi:MULTISPECIES: replication protein [Streptomyces]|uniref:replication protein n=1 Tax=Streptomyces TaxID=1883 RepID=UPI0037D81A94